MRLGFVGTGEITSSIVTGLRSSGGTDHAICLSPRNPVIARELANHFDGVSVASSNQEVLDRSETIVIAVRPPAVREVLSSLRFRSDHHVVSLVSGLSIRGLAALVIPAEQVTRAVPLPSTAHRLSPTAIHPADPAALALFGALGVAFPVESEDAFNALSAATATIATYFAFNEAIASWLERRGVSARQAREYVARLFLGVTTGAVDESDRSFQSLAASHATAGGINAQVLEHLTQHGVLVRVSEALDAVLTRIGADASA